ncbi:pentapeptide repeat-containing protein [Sphingopyxis terrae]|uniref:pentapeptide repeat-containing protein n=1 Tax=Sphingopyxis terrae TaxID=33052 RepID=UPI0009ED7987|nr:pentapeptide repeat-containing protein [Sphingopyxis terrae]
MTQSRSSFDIVLTILQSGLSSLKDLAVLSGRDSFTFYRDADLRNLDLSNQDLSGLDFRGTDMRGSALKNSTIDRGALNNTKIDIEYSFLKDEYDTTMEDFSTIFNSSIYCFCKFREGFLDRAFKFISMPFSDFCGKYKFSEGALRKARRGDPVTTNTCLTISNGIIKEIRDRFGTEKRITDSCDITIGHFPYKNMWKRLERLEYIELSYMAERVNIVFEVEGPYLLGSGPINSTIEASKWRRYRVRAGAAGSIATRKAARA